MPGLVFGQDIAQVMRLYRFHCQKPSQCRRGLQPLS